MASSGPPPHLLERANHNMTLGGPTRMSVDRKLLEARIARAQRALWTEWAPIELRGMDPPWSDDEYDSYALVVVGLLERGASDTEVATYLWSVESEQMGLEPRMAPVLE